PVGVEPLATSAPIPLTATTHSPMMIRAGRRHPGGTSAWSAGARSGWVMGVLRFGPGVRARVQADSQNILNNILSGFAANSAIYSAPGWRRTGTRDAGQRGRRVADYGQT